MAAEPLQRPRSHTVIPAPAAVLLALLGGLAIWLLSAPRAAAAPATRAGVAQCELGTYLSDLYDIDPAKDRFSARLWLWTLCPDRSVDPLPQVSYSNADEPHTTDPHVVAQGGRVLDQVRLQSTFRQGWDVRDFPFDHHRIEVLLTAPDDTSHFRFTVNNADSEFNPEIRLQGWHVTGFRLATVDKHYTTTYGDRTLKDGSTYNRVRIQIDLERTDATTFWKLTAPIYLAVLVATSTFLLSFRHEELGPAERLDALYNRLAVLGGALFVAVLNMQQANTVITSTDGLTLIDYLHLATLTFLLAAVIATVLSWRWTIEGGSPARAERLSYRGAWIALLGYTATCGALVLLAAER
ncbi:hypothetical protein ACIBCO_31255 [Streptomyces violascens]|uniref:hypothetical protein n=1 Tax=Streptomyces violascens TaxID=67381 RepID=UPI0037AB88FC